MTWETLLIKALAVNSLRKLLAHKVASLETLERTCSNCGLNHLASVWLQVIDHLINIFQACRHILRKNLRLDVAD